ncbi:hypothetical protein BC834DRAFT_598188 [Gloeopeniophorella convolvens]|nr:hypothetical protein BC834DRAFT_598188 [Gloeopeniophorella convolvens]
MWFPLKPAPNAQRKYVDLIMQASGKWPNWDPPKTVQPGDFGSVEGETGEFVSEGNIYSLDVIKDLAVQHPIRIGDRVDRHNIHSYEVTGMDASVEQGLDTSGIHCIALKSKWKFSSKRGAILLMHEPQMTYVPDEFLSEVLKRKDILKDKCVVNQVYTCSGFYMYLSNKTREELTVSLRTSVPIAGPVYGTHGAKIGWHCDRYAGVQQSAYNAESRYTPLFAMKTRKRRMLRRGDPMSGKENWEETDVPWDDLDEDGEPEPEIEYYDEDSS